MARGSFKRRTSRAIAKSCERSTYALAASLAILLWITQWRPIPAIVWNVEAPFARVALWSGFAAGWLVMASSAITLDALSLSGLRQAFAFARGETGPVVPFRVPMGGSNGTCTVAFTISPTVAVPGDARVLGVRFQDVRYRPAR